jgi:hypothetical protein
MGRKERIQETEQRQQSSCLGFGIIDIASPEELFEHDGPLLAEDSEWYHYRRYVCQEEKEEVTDGVQAHVKRVMEQAKVRKVHERSVMASNEQLMMETMASLQAAQERMELRARASAALEAAAKRAAAAKNSADALPEKEKDLSKPALKHFSTTKKPPTAPGPISRAPPAARRSQPQAAESLQDRINRVLAEAQRRNQEGYANHGADNYELWEQTTTASSISAADSGSESGAEWQPSMFWGTMPR